MIDIKNVSKTYNGNVLAINNVSLKINNGEIVGFIGLNGAGKTTLIKMMCGILTIDTGTIKINGFDINKDAMEAKKIIGYISDNPDMFLRLTGFEFINLICDIYNVDEKVRKSRMLDLCGRFDLVDLLDKQLVGYSHGNRQKMMVVATLMHDPKVWILDEPMVGLDPKSALVLKKMMKEHASKGNSVFFSTHVLEVAEKLCDKVAIINKGKIIYYGTLEDLKKDYKKKDLEALFMEVIKNE